MQQQQRRCVSADSSAQTSDGDSRSCRCCCQSTSTILAEKETRDQSQGVWSSHGGLFLRVVLSLSGAAATTAVVGAAVGSSFSMEKCITVLFLLICISSCAPPPLQTADTLTAHQPRILRGCGGGGFGGRPSRTGPAHERRPHAGATQSLGGLASARPACRCLWPAFAAPRSLFLGEPLNNAGNEGSGRETKHTSTQQPRAKPRMPGPRQCPHPSFPFCSFSRRTHHRSYRLRQLSRGEIGGGDTMDAQDETRCDALRISSQHAFQSQSETRPLSIVDAGPGTRARRMN